MWSTSDCGALHLSEFVAPTALVVNSSWGCMPLLLNLLLLRYLLVAVIFQLSQTSSAFLRFFFRVLIVFFTKKRYSWSHLLIFIIIACIILDALNFFFVGQPFILRHRLKINSLFILIPVHKILSDRFHEFLVFGHLLKSTFNAF